MIDRICLLLEALSVVICLHHLYGEKFRPDIKTVGFLAVDMIIMEFINHYELSKSYTMIIYPVIVIYCGLRFGFKVRELIVNNILYMVIVSVIQLVVMLIYHYVFGVNIIGGNLLLLANSTVMLVIIFCIPKRRIGSITKYLQDKERLSFLIIIISVIMVIYCLFGYKDTNQFALYQSVLVFVSVVLICLLAALLGKTKIKAKEIETELRMHELYADSYKALIENVRMRQHEFDNHISTIYSQHLLCDTYDSLVEMQKDYCKELEKENRYNKLLKYDNHVIRGFLYVKFLEVEKVGVEVSYEVVIDKLVIRMPVYKLVEVLGDLINNAVEAMVELEDKKKLHVTIIEVEEKVRIEVRNISRYIPHNEISRFFEKGYSKKGTNRGLGLYNVKKICEEYGFEVACENKEIDGLNWLSFMIYNKI